MQHKYKELVEFIRNELAQHDRFVPLHEPSFQGHEKEYLLETIESGFVSSVGEFVNRFEREFAAYLGAEYAVATVNGTAALHAALVVAGIEPGDEVITQAITFVATANAIHYAGAKPIFADVDAGRLTLSVDSIVNFLAENAEMRSDGYCYNKVSGHRIYACVPVHVFGFIADMAGLKKVCEQYNIVLIEDAAESLGSRYKGEHSGKQGKLSAFSFNGNKIVTAGGGGAIVTNDEELARVAKHITTTAKMSHPWDYKHDMIGYNYRMPNVNAALLCAQLEQLDGFLDKKKAIATKYHEQFHNLDIPYVKATEDENPNYWLINMLLEDANERDSFLSYSNEKSIMTRPLWALMSDLPIYSSCQTTELTNSHYMRDRLVNLPSSSNLS